MDVRFCEGRDHSREALGCELKILTRKCALSRARLGPRVFFLDRRLTWMSVSHTMHLLAFGKDCVCHMWAVSAAKHR